MYKKLVAETWSSTTVERQFEFYGNTAECTAERANVTVANQLQCASGSVLYDTEDADHPMYTLNIKADGSREWI